MPRQASSKKTNNTTRASKKTTGLTTTNYLNRIENDIKNNQSKLSMVLGGLIILVIGILIFNYFNKSKPVLGPAQQSQQEQQAGDVSPSNLPGKYTVKEGDTLFLIAERYYNDGERFEEIAKTNNLADVNTIEVGQVLEIPKLSDAQALVPPTASPEATTAPTEAPSAAPTSSPALEAVPTQEQDTPSGLGKGGSNNTIWGPRIEGTTYTVQEGDWLSTIAARAYGDVFAFRKLAEANNIINPDYIIPGQVLKIPR